MNLTDLSFWEMMRFVGVFFIVLLCVIAAAMVVWVLRELFAEQNQKIRRLKKDD